MRPDFALDDPQEMARLMDLTGQEYMVRESGLRPSFHGDVYRPVTTAKRSRFMFAVSK